MKHIVIPTCRHCPYAWSDYFRGHFMQAKCNHSSFEKEFDWERSYRELDQKEYESTTTPEWCPLDDL